MGGPARWARSFHSNGSRFSADCGWSVIARWVYDVRLCISVLCFSPRTYKIFFMNLNRGKRTRGRGGLYGTGGL